MAKPAAAPLKPVILKFKDKAHPDIDLSKALPITAGDWSALKKKGVKLGSDHNLIDDPDAMIEFVLWFAQKAVNGETVNRDMILDIPVTRCIAAVQYLHEGSKDAGDPN